MQINRCTLPFLIALLLLTAHFVDAQQRKTTTTASVSFKRAGNGFHVETPAIGLDYDLTSGLYDLHWGAQQLIHGATCAARLADGAELKAGEYARHECGAADIVTIRDGFGAGLKITVHHRSTGRPELRQTLWLYRDRSYLFVSLDVVSPTAIGSNHIEPLVVEASAQTGIAQDVGDPLQVLFVPFDNDGYVRYNSHDWEPEADSYEVTAFYDNTSRHGFVVGSVSHDLWKTGFAIRGIGKARVGGLRVYSGATGRWSHDKQPHGTVYGMVIRSPRIFIGWFPDWRDGMENYGNANAILTPPLKWSGGVPFGWNSWAAHKDKIRYEHVVAASDFLKQTLQPRGFMNDNTAYVNMDAFWDFIPEEKFRQAVAHIHANGQKAGIYWTPFTGWGDDLNRTVEGTNGRYTYRDIVLKDDAGNPLPKLDGGWPLDPTHPGTEMRSDWQFRRFIDWGFDFVKLDFMSHGALEGAHYDHSVPTGIAAYNLGMKRIVETFDPAKIGRSFFISLSIAPLFPSGYAHSRRISCDAFADIGATEYMLSSVTYGWWANGNLYRYNDPDHTVVYKVHGEAPVTEAEGRSRLNASLIAGTVLLNSDDLTDAATRQRVEALFTNPDLNALARRGQSFRPVEGDTGSQATDAFVLNVGSELYLAIFNFNGNAPSTKTLSLARIGLNASARYRLRDLWTQQVSTATNVLTVNLGPAASTIFRVTKETGTSSPRPPSPKRRRGETLNPNRLLRDFLLRFGEGGG